MHRLTLYLILFLLAAPVHAQTGDVTFIYARDTDGGSLVCWFAVDSPTDERCLDTPRIAQYALSPVALALAIRDTDGELYLADLAAGEVAAFDLCQPNVEFLWDTHYQTSGSLLWSPTGRYLAFTGVAPQSTCAINDRANIYLYDTQTRTLTNLTQAMPVIRSLILPASWSPDETWLALYGAWSQAPDTVPDWGAAIIARDGSQFFTVAPEYNTCRLVWSPDMRWLASNTACFEPLGAGSALIVIPFDPLPLTPDGPRIDQAVSPLRFDWRAGSTWLSNYSPPLWTAPDMLVAHRAIMPVSFGYLPEDRTAELTASGLVTVDLDTITEMPLLPDDFTTDTHLLGGWFVSETYGDGPRTAYNPLRDARFTIPERIPMCPVSYALKIDPAGDYLAVLNGCVSPDAPLSVDVYRTDTFTRVRRIASPDASPHRPLGFARRP